jgi:mRNA-degrading endonuclease RelE of RelBE toxin-antitoxin system
MVIIETSVFTRQLMSLLTDDEYRELQVALASRPDAGRLIVGGGGIRKLRWGVKGRGKGGGVRVIYYWAVEEQRLLMLLIYEKAVRDDLTAEQLKSLRRLVEEEWQ